MNAQNSIYATLITIVLVGVLLLRSSISIVPEDRLSTLLPPNNVWGIEVVYQGVPYTLNFTEQQDMLELINRSLAIGKLSAKPTPLPGLDKISIYLFTGAQLDLWPVDFTEDNLYFHAPSLLKQGYLMDVSGGSFAELIQHVH